MADQKDDTLTVRPSAPPAHLAPLLEGFKRLYASKDYADVIITCQGQEFKAHRLCLCAQSEYFQKMLGGTFKEATEGKVSADDDSPQVIEALIHYFYNFNYGEYTNRDTDVAPIVLDVKMHAIADKYLVEPLKKLSAAKFEARAKEDWGTTAFADAVAEIYDTTLESDEPIKIIALETIRANSKEPLNRQRPYVSFLKVLRETADLGADLATSLEDLSSITKYKCPSCNTILEVGYQRNCRLGCNGCGNYGNQMLSWWASYMITE